MPKRDEAYMEGQRELIERAALECLLDKGVYDTTLRDVCERVGMSMGALYVHYRTRDDLFVAALRLEPVRQLTPVSTWPDYIAAPRQFLQRLSSTDDRSRRRMRLALQFVAEHALATENPPGFTELFQLSVGYYRECLQAIQRRGEITLPLGLRATSELHHRLEIGTIRGLIAVLGIGSSPGKTNLLAARAVRELEGTPKSISVTAAGRDLDPPEGLSFPYAVRTLLDEITMPPMALINGEPRELRADAGRARPSTSATRSASAETIFTLHSEVLTFGESFGAENVTFALVARAGGARGPEGAGGGERGASCRNGALRIAPVRQHGLGPPGRGRRRGDGSARAQRHRAPRGSGASAAGSSRPPPRRRPRSACSPAAGSRRPASFLPSAASSPTRCSPSSRPAASASSSAKWSP